MLGNTCNFTEFDVKLQTFYRLIKQTFLNDVHVYILKACDKNIFILVNGLPR